jgi:PAS domain S-box-containing protein
MNASGEVQRLNRQLLEYFGKTTEELKNWATSDVVHPDDRARVVAAFASSIETGLPYDIEHRCRRADGVYLWFQVRALPVRDTKGHINSWYVLLSQGRSCSRSAPRTEYATSVSAAGTRLTAPPNVQLDFSQIETVTSVPVARH